MNNRALQKISLLLFFWFHSISGNAQNLIARQYSGLVAPISADPGINHSWLMTGALYDNVNGLQGTLLKIDSAYNYAGGILSTGSNNSVRSYGAYQRANGNIVQLSISKLKDVQFNEYDSSLNLLNSTVWQYPLIFQSCLNVLSFNKFRGNFIFVQGANSNNVVFCWDTTGALLWQREIDNSGNFVFSKAQPANDGGYYLLGTFVSSFDSQLLIIKIDGNGNYEWGKTFGNSTHFESANSIAETITGELIIAGNSLLDTGNYRIVPSQLILLKMDTAHHAVWSEVIGGPWHTSSSVKLMGNEIIVAGNSMDDIGVSVYTEKGRGILLNVDMNGNFNFGKYLGATGTGLINYDPICFMDNGINNNLTLLTGSFAYHSNTLIFSVDSLLTQQCVSTSISPVVTPLIYTENTVSTFTTNISLLSNIADTILVNPAPNYYTNWCNGLSFNTIEAGNSSYSVLNSTHSITLKNNMVLNKLNEEFICKVFDITGRLVLHLKPETDGSFVVDKELLKNGLYCGEVISGTTTLFKTKLLVVD